MLEFNKLASRSYRYLARQIDNDLAQIKGGRTIAFSSTQSLSFSTETTLMFSFFLQDELDSKVLIVDGIFRSGGVGSRLGYSENPGLLNYLYQKKSRWQDYVCNTQRESMSVLPSGVLGVSDNGFYSLDPDKVGSMVREAKEKFDYILIQQGSPLEDTRYLHFTAMTDMVVLLAEEGITMVEDLESCQKFFKDYQISNVRLVISKPD